jgi:hypothetical protein
MKSIATFVIFPYRNSWFTQDKKKLQNSSNVEVSMWQCQFGMQGHGCELAVQMTINVFCRRTSIDSHGDAHSNEGFCTNN